MHAELGSDLRPNCKVSACITFIGMFGLGYLSKDLGWSGLEKKNPTRGCQVPSKCKRERFAYKTLVIPQKKSPI